MSITAVSNQMQPSDRLSNLIRVKSPCYTKTLLSLYLVSYCSVYSQILTEASHMYPNDMSNFL